MRQPEHLSGGAAAPSNQLAVVLLASVETFLIIIIM
jgi:hypothetical protein